MNYNLILTAEVGVECWNCPGEQGVGQGAKLLVLNSRCLSLSEWTWVKQQRLKAGVGWQANLPKPGKWWIPELIFWNRGQHSKLNCPNFLREELTRVSAEGQCSCRLVKKTTALTTLHELADLPHLTVATNLEDRWAKHYSQASHLVRQHQSFHFYTNTTLDA
jgi:hypothetical protein